MFRVDKDPQAILDYGFDWSEWLGSDTISSSSWTADTGINIDSDTNTSTITSVWLSSGLPGHNYRVVNHVITAAGREDDRTILVSVEQR